MPSWWGRHGWGRFLCKRLSHSLLTEEDSPADCLRDTRRQVRFRAQGPLLTIQSLVRVGGQPPIAVVPGGCAPGKESVGDARSWSYGSAMAGAAPGAP